MVCVFLSHTHKSTELRQMWINFLLKSTAANKKIFILLNTTYAAHIVLLAWFTYFITLINKY